jgi:hypothetical protein
VKRLVLAAALVCVAAPAFATGGTATSPFYVREQQGVTRTFKEVSCTTAGDVALVTVAEAANARSILFQNSKAENVATLCPVAAAAGVCDAANEGMSLWPKGSLPIDRAVRDGAWSCRALAAAECVASNDPVACCTGPGTGPSCGTVIVEVLIEK